MPDSSSERWFDRGGGSDEPIGQDLVPGIIWLAGLASTLYLVGWASFLVFIAVVFRDHSPQVSEWDKLAFVGMNALPLCCFVVIGFVSLRFWPHRRFRLLGLSAILLQTLSAVCCYVRPEGVLVFIDWYT